MGSEKMSNLQAGRDAYIINGAKVYAGYLDAARQAHLVNALRKVGAEAPFFSPRTRFGKHMSVKMTSAGRYGWYSDARGYRYERCHPAGLPWPDVPPAILELWRSITKLSRDPDCCLVNFYGQGARMGLHQDRDEASFDWPVVSVSLGDDALFRIGGHDRKDATRSVWLKSGDVLVLEGESRLAFHGIDRIRFGSSTLLVGGGRINLTLRVVD